MGDVATRPDAKAAAIRHLWRLDETRGEKFPYLYALLDAARDEAIYPALRRFAARTEIASLYQGPTAQELAAVAPYLVSLGTGGEIFDWIWDSGWGKGWGIFIWCLVDFEGLRAHFRKLTKVRTEDGQVLLFRFYDPRVLSVFLPTCSAGQVRDMFGPVGYFLLAGPDRANIQTFGHSDGDLLEQILEVS